MEGKMKISFGIKTSKQVSLTKKAPVVNNDVEYIRSFDSTCKPMSMGGARKDDALVIPSRGNHTSLDQLTNRMTAKLEVKESVAGAVDNAVNTPFPAGSLEQLAAQELLKDAKDAILHKAKTVDVVPLPTDRQLDATEATLDDYESIPVAEFGKAMLRGMGWEPNKGIGKNQRVVAPSAPQLRPRGLGLGADRVTLSTSQLPMVSGQQGAGQEEVTPLTIGCGVQIIAGGSGGLYGKVVSHNEDTGRCIVKLEIGASTVSVNESLVKVVGKEEYAKNCRVLNASKYKEYKESSDDRLREMRDGTPSSLEERPMSSERRRGRHRSRSPHKT